MAIYTTQEMATKTGVSISTLRYYERVGLLDPVTRLDNGHRRYGDADVLRVTFLKRLRATGMPISQMQHYVDLFRAGNSTVPERIAILEAHRTQICKQMDELQATLDLLDMKLARYRHEEHNDLIINEE